MDFIRRKHKKSGSQENVFDRILVMTISSTTETLELCYGWMTEDESENVHYWIRPWRTWKLDEPEIVEAMVNVFNFVKDNIHPFLAEMLDSMKQPTSKRNRGSETEEDGGDTSAQRRRIG